MGWCVTGDVHLSCCAGNAACKVQHDIADPKSHTTRTKMEDLVELGTPRYEKLLEARQLTFSGGYFQGHMLDQVVA